MNRKAVSGIVLAMLLMGTLACAFNIQLIKAEPVTSLSAWASSPPTIDGVLSASEWDSAATIEFTITYLVGEPTKGGTLYVMNDLDNLYLAVKIEDDDLNLGDVLDFHFDNDNDGNREDGDDVLGFDVNYGFYDSFWRTDFGLHGHLMDWVDGGTSDGMAAASGDGFYNVFEFSHPLQSADINHDFTLNAGDSVGFLIGYDDDGRIGWHWPSNLWSEYLDFTRRGEIIVVPQSPTPLQALEELVQTVESYNLDYGVETSLISKLRAAHQSLDKENTNASMGPLIAFINQVEVLRDRKLTTQQADQLTSEVQRIIDLIEE